MSSPPDPGHGGHRGDPALAEREARRAARMAEIAERHRELAVQADRDKWHDVLWTAVRCVLWMLLGAFPLAWSFHTTDPIYGRAAFTAGVGIANGGIIFTLLGLYRRGEQRGDW